MCRRRTKQATKNCVTANLPSFCLVRAYSPLLTMVHAFKKVQQEIWASEFSSLANTWFWEFTAKKIYSPCFYNMGSTGKKAEEPISRFSVTVTKSSRLWGLSDCMWDITHKYNFQISNYPRSSYTVLLLASGEQSASCRIGIRHLTKVKTLYLI